MRVFAPIPGGSNIENVRINANCFRIIVLGDYPGFPVALFRASMVSGNGVPSHLLDVSRFPDVQVNIGCSPAELTMADQEKQFKIVADNRQARHNYFLSDFMEAGLVLTGTEVKSARRLIAFCFQSEIEKTGTDILWPFTHRL